MENRTIQFQKKEYLRALYEEKIERFKKSEARTMTIRPISWVPGQDFSDAQVTYTKIIKKVGKGRIFIIKKDGRPISFTWETKPENIKTAVAAGIVNPEALTGKVISAIGDYQARIFERAYEDGIVSNKYQEKKALLTFWQKRVVMLQPLERLINTNKSVKEVNAALDSYIEAVEAYKSTFAEGMAGLEKYDVTIQKKLAQFLDDDISAIREFKSSIVAGTPLKSWLAAFGTTSLMTKLNVMMINMAKQAQGINQNLTHARPGRDDSFIQSLRRGDFSLFRGYFNDICEDVMRVINTHDPDLHNPVLPEHQGDFSAQKEAKQDEKEKKSEEKDGAILTPTLELSPEVSARTSHTQGKKLYLEFSPDNRKALAAICQIEKADEIRFSAKGDFSLKKQSNIESPELPLQKTGYTSWWLNDASINHSTIPVRVAYFVLNVISGVLLTIPDIFCGLAVGLFRLEQGSLVELAKKNPKKELPDTTYSGIAKNMKVPDRHIAFGIAYILGEAMGALILDLTQGAILAVEQFRVEFPALIENDYYIGGWGDKERSVQNIEQQFERDIKEIQNKQGEQDTYYKVEHEYLGDSETVPNNLTGKPRTRNPRTRNPRTRNPQFSVSSSGGATSSVLDIKQPADDRHFAAPPYHLSSGEWEDIVSATPRGLKAFAGSILYPIHVKNPFVGLVYNFFYFAGGFSVLVPHAVPLPQPYKDFSQWLGGQIAHDRVAQAVSSAVTQGQVAAIAVEAPMHGPKSMLGQVFHTLEESMVDVSVLILLAWSGGLALKAVPVMGDFIRAEMGNAGYITLATYGGKMGMLIHELCEAEEQKPVNEEYTHNLKAEWVELATKLKDDVEKTKTFKEASPEQQQTITAAFNNVTSVDVLEKMVTQAKFLKNLTTHSHLLPHLPSRTKREMLQAAEELFGDKPEVVMAVKNMLDPYKPYSIASRTLRILMGYVICVLRIVPGCLLTGNLKQPVQDLATKVAKDLVRVVRGLYGLGAFVVLALYAALYTPVRAIADVFFNGFVARMEGWTLGTHHVSEVTSQESARISRTYHKLGEFLTPTTLYQKVTQPDPRVVMRDPSSQYFGTLFDEARVRPSSVSSATLDGASESPRTRSSSSSFSSQGSRTEST